MSKKLGVVMDPIGAINFHKDSTLAMLLAAAKRGWQLYYMEQGDLFLQDSRCHARLSPLQVRADENDWYSLSDAVTAPLDELDVVVMRKDDSDTTSAQPMRRIHPVETIAVQLQDGYQYRHDYLGEVVARRSSELGFELAGRIIAMDVSEGDVFELGAVLAKLDTDRLVEQRIELTARADQIDAKLQEVIVGPGAETIAAAEATVKDLNHQLELAQRNRKRRQQLVDRQMAAREDLDAAQFGAQSIAAKLDVAQHQLDELKAGTRDEVIQAQKAAFAQAKSLLAQNQIEIDRSVIRAPYDCTVTRRMADVGQVVAAGTQILSVVANREPEVWIGVPIDQSQSLKKDCQTDVLINGQTHQGVCKNIVPQLDQATRTMTVIVSLGGATIDQVPGQLVGASVELAVGELFVGTAGRRGEHDRGRIRGAVGLGLDLHVHGLEGVGGPGVVPLQQGLRALLLREQRDLGQGAIRFGRHALQHAQIAWRKAIAVDTDHVAVLGRGGHQMRLTAMRRVMTVQSTAEVEFLRGHAFHLLTYDPVVRLRIHPAPPLNLIVHKITDTPRIFASLAPLLFQTFAQGRAEFFRILDLLLD